MIYNLIYDLKYRRYLRRTRVALAQNVKIDIHNLSALKCNYLKQKGHVPSIHGDDHAHPAPMGCGFFKLWSLSKLDGIAPPKFDSKEGQDAVLEAGGVYEQLTGSHEEKVVYTNFVPNTTIAPEGDDQAFALNA